MKKGSVGFPALLFYQEGAENFIMELGILYGLLVVLLIVCFLIVYKPWRSEELKKHIERKTVYFLVIAVGLFIRFYQVDSLPGLQIDEAMAGYDAWSLANYGMDSATNSLPVYLYSYGTGQSALYAYLSVPFIKLLGLNLLSIRMAMLLVSSVTLIFAAKTFNQWAVSKKWSFLFLVVLVTNPWHFVLSRFGLDANLAPQFLLMAICTLLWAINTDNFKVRWLNYLVSVLFISLTAYAYIASWFLLPIFCILLFIYLIREKYLSIQQMLICGGLLVFLVSPLIIFAGNQFWGNNNLSLLGITIPKLAGTQLDGQTILSGSQFGTQLIANIKQAIDFIFVWHLKDGLLFNGLPGFSVFYSGFFLLFVIGVVVIYRKKDTLAILTKCWLLSCLPIILLTKPLVHHWNFLFFPVLIVAVYGLDYLLTSLSEKIYQAFLIYLATMFLIFQFNYFFSYRHSLQDSEYTAPQELGKILNEIQQLNMRFEKIYVYSTSFPQVGNEFIYKRFFDPISPLDWQATKDSPNDTADNMTKNQYGKYIFLEDEVINFEDQQQAGYLIHKNSSLSLPDDAEVNYAGLENDFYYFIYFS